MVKYEMAEGTIKQKSLDERRSLAGEDECNR